MCEINCGKKEWCLLIIITLLYVHTCPTPKDSPTITEPHRPTVFLTFLFSSHPLNPQSQILTCLHHIKKFKKFWTTIHSSHVYFLAVPNAPQILIPRVTLASSLRVSWPVPVGYLDYYLLYYTPSDGQPDSPVTIPDSVNPIVTLTNLLDNTDYTLRVMSVSGDGLGETVSETFSDVFRTSKSYRFCNPNLKYFSTR